MPARYPGAGRISGPCQDDAVPTPALVPVLVDMGEAGTVRGAVASGWERVLQAFVANFTTYGDTGSGACVYRWGRPVVDLVGGWARRRQREPYGERSLQLVFSATKGVTALCAHMLAERGELDLDAPVASLWRAFGAAGKAALPVRWLLTHQAGLPTVDTPLTLDQALAWEPVVDALAIQAPYWAPGTAHGYHALTFGWLVGEVVRRVSGRSLGRFVAEEVARPLGLDLFVGLPAAEEPRVVPLHPGRTPVAARRQHAGRVPDAQRAAAWARMLRPDSLALRALSLNGVFGSFGRGGPFDTRAVRAAEIPAGNGITDARSLARLYAAMLGEVDGVRLLGEAQLRLAATPTVSGPDRVLGADSCFGLGFQCHHPTYAPLLGPGSFGHSGVGGSVGLAHPASGVAVGFVVDQLRFGLSGDDRATRLLDAVRACS